MSVKKELDQRLKVLKDEIRLHQSLVSLHRAFISRSEYIFSKDGDSPEFWRKNKNGLVRLFRYDIDMFSFGNDLCITISDVDAYIRRYEHYLGKKVPVEIQNIKSKLKYVNKKKDQFKDTYINTLKELI